MEWLKYIIYGIAAVIVLGFVYRLFAAAFWADVTNGDRK